MSDDYRKGVKDGLITAWALDSIFALVTRLPLWLLIPLLLAAAFAWWVY